MSDPDRATELRKLTEPLTRACELAERHEDFVLAAKLSDCIEWIQAARYDGAGHGDASR
jgi:hypothetical protein